MISRVLYVELLFLRLKTILHSQTDEWSSAVPSEALGSCRYDVLNIVRSRNSNQTLELRVSEDLSLSFRIEVMSAEVPLVSVELVAASRSRSKPKMPEIEVGYPLFWLSRSLFAFVSLAQKMLEVWDDIRRYFFLADASESSFFAPLLRRSRVWSASSFGGCSRLCQLPIYQFFLVLELSSGL